MDFELLFWIVLTAACFGIVLFAVNSSTGSRLTREQLDNWRHHNG